MCTWGCSNLWGCSGDYVTWICSLSTDLTSSLTAGTRLDKLVICQVLLLNFSLNWFKAGNLSAGFVGQTKKYQNLELNSAVNVKPADIWGIGFLPHRTDFQSTRLPLEPEIPSWCVAYHVTVREISNLDLDVYTLGRPSQAGILKMIVGIFRGYADQCWTCWSRVRIDLPRLVPTSPPQPYLRTRQLCETKEFIFALRASARE